MTIIVHWQLVNTYVAVFQLCQLVHVYVCNENSSQLSDFVFCMKVLMY